MTPQQAFLYGFAPLREICFFHQVDFTFDLESAAALLSNRHPNRERGDWSRKGIRDLRKNKVFPGVADSSRLTASYLPVPAPAVKSGLGKRTRPNEIVFVHVPVYRRFTSRVFITDRDSCYKFCHGFQFASRNRTCADANALPCWWGIARSNQIWRRMLRFATRHDTLS